MSTSKVEKITKAVTAVDNWFRLGDGLKSKKTHNTEKDKSVLADLRELIVSSDFNILYKADKRYADIYNKAVDVVFSLLDQPDHSLRTYAADTLDAIFRTQLLTFNHHRIVVPLINEISRNSGPRATAGAINRLAEMIQYSKNSRIISYGAHILGALTTLLKRPEELIQQSILQNVAMIFSTIGPRLREHHTEKAFHLYQQAADNLEIGGTSSRAAAAVISQTCTYYPSILQKAFARCAMHIRNCNEEQSKVLLVGWLNTYKSLWQMVVQNVKLISEDHLKICCTGILCCLFSSHSEVIVAAIEALDVMTGNPIPFLYEFTSADFSFVPSVSDKRLSSRGQSTSSFAQQGSDSKLSLRGSPSNSNHSSFFNLDSSVSFDTALDLSDVFDDDADSLNNEEIIDPLTRPDLYNEISREDHESSRLSTPTDTSFAEENLIPTAPPQGSCPIDGNFFICSAVLLGRLFLLSGLKGLRNDRETRISHKILALNCLTTISKSVDLREINVVFVDCEQHLSEVIRFIRHDDDQLSAAAVGLMFQLYFIQGDGNKTYCEKILNSTQPIRKRAVLQAAIGNQTALLRANLFDEFIELAISEIDTTFALLRITCAEFIASVMWANVSFETRNKYQNQAHEAFLSLVLTTDQKISEAAIQLLPRLVKNADISHFVPRFSDEFVTEKSSSFPDIPAVLNLSNNYRFLNETPDHVMEANLEHLLTSICAQMIDDSDQKSGAFCKLLEVLMDEFPPSVYNEVWGCVSKIPSTSSGFLSTVLDFCETCFTNPITLASGLNVIAKLFAGHCEGHMISVVREQQKVDRSSLPKLPEATVLERIFLLVLRIINLYYSLLAERKAILAQSGSSTINRPGLSPLTPRKTSPSRLADISRLLGTSVHPSKPTSYLHSATITSIVPYLQGAYATYLENISSERDSKFTFLLQSALDCLCTISEMISFKQLKPLLEEILLYTKVLTQICPEGSSKLLHQMFKVVFGKNAANISLEFLNSMKLKDPTPPRDEEEMYYLQDANEFTMFSSLIRKKEFIENNIHSELGWLRPDMLAKIHNPKNEEITPALELFEGYVTRLRAIYISYQSIECRKVILGIMCELCRNGIIYTMADPKKILYDAVLLQAEDPSPGNCEMLQEIAMFHVVLCRSGFMQCDKLTTIASSLIDKATEFNCSDVLSYARILILEFLYVQHKLDSGIYESILRRSTDLIRFAPKETLDIWILLLNSCRNDRNRWNNMSKDFKGCYFAYLKEGYDYICGFVPSISALSSAILESTEILQTISSIWEKNDDLNSLSFWRSCLPLLFSAFNFINSADLTKCILEDETAEELLSRTASRMVKHSFSCNSPDTELYAGTLLRILNSLSKACNHSSFINIVMNHLNEVNLSDIRWEEHPNLCSLFAQLMVSTGKAELSPIRERFPESCHMQRLLSILSKSQTESTLQVVKRKRTIRHMHVEETLQLFLQNSFKEYSRRLPSIVFTPLLEENVNISDVTADLVSFELVVNDLCRELVLQLEGAKANKEQHDKIVERAEQITDHLINLTDPHILENIKLHLSVVGILSSVINSGHIKWKQYNGKNLIDIFNVASSHLDDLGNDHWSGLSTIFNSSSAIDIFSHSTIELLSAISSFLERILPTNLVDYSSSCSFNCSDTTNVDLFKKLFDQSQNVVDFSKSSKFSECVLNGLRVLFRHPILHAFVMAPTSAFKSDWKLRIEIKSTEEVYATLISIHLLSNLDILHDFSWRINWLGWVSRQQFEDYWMSLFGVLSSTPTGSEISAEDPMNLTERILASSYSVDTLTYLLLYTLLFPVPGNVANGHFVMKHREKSDLFYETEDVNTLRTLQARLRCHLNDPSCLYSRNLERVSDTGGVYNLAQLSAFSLWTITGVLKHPGKVHQIPLSMSEYLLKTTCELDTASSVRALFENYSHWFSRGLAHLPLPLLSSTVRSMALLSDLFDETQSYEFLYTQMKAVFRGGFLDNHADLGYVIYSLLKSFTVLGMENIERSMTEADMSKQIQTWVEAGLTNPDSFVREATLHGVNYMLQSMSVDSLRPVFQYIASIILTDIDNLLNDSFHFQDLSCSKTYFDLIFSVAFHMIEEPMQINFQSVMTQKLVQWFKKANQHVVMHSLVCTGIEELILHSSSYIPQFLGMVLECFKEYTAMNTLFLYALRIFVTCAYRDEVDSKKVNANNKFAAHVDELLSIFRRCDTRDAKAISGVLPSILMRISGENQAITTIIELCGKCLNTPNCRFVLKMVNEILQQTRTTVKRSQHKEVAVHVRQFALALPKNQTHLAVKLLISAHPSPDIHQRFYYFLNVEDEEFCAAHYEWILALSQDV